MDFPKWIKSLPSEQHEFLSYQLEGKTCDTYFSEIKQGTFIAPHQHDNTVLNFIAEGQITIEQNGMKQTYNAGDWCEIPKQTTHTLLANTNSRLIEFWLKS